MALLQSARKKTAAGQTLTAREKKTVKDFELEKRREYGVQYLRAMPKGDFIKLFGGSFKVNIEWNAEYGFPWPDKGKHDVDCVVMLEWYRDNFINGSRGGSDNPEDILLQGASQSLKDEYVRERIREKRITNQHRTIELEAVKASYLPMTLIMETHNSLAERIRKTRERLTRHFDGEAKEKIELAFEGLVEDFIRDVEDKFGDGDSGDDIT